MLLNRVWNASTLRCCLFRPFFRALFLFCAVVITPVCPFPFFFFCCCCLASLGPEPTRAQLSLFLFPVLHCFASSKLCFTWLLLCFFISLLFFFLYFCFLCASFIICASTNCGVNRCGHFFFFCLSSMCGYYLSFFFFFFLPGCLKNNKKQSFSPVLLPRFLI